MYHACQKEGEATDVPLLGYKPIKYLLDKFQPEVNMSIQQRIFQNVEETGCEISYRCPKCRSCKDCKHHDEYQAVSIREEVEQSLINSSVSINLEESTTSASLPFIADPQRLVNNKNNAMKVYFQQIRKLNQPANSKNKEEIIESEKKLHQLGYVDYLSNLSPDVQNTLRNHTIQYFIPWRAVWKGNSISTPLQNCL